MAEKKGATTTPPVQEQNVVLERAKGFWAKFSKPIIYAGSVIIVLCIAWFGYKKFIKQPKEDKANEMIFLAEGIYDKMASTGSYGKDSVNIVLNGGLLEGTTVPGLLKLISNYDGTASANRAKYIVGAVYLQVNDFDKAIKYMDGFDAEGAKQIQSKADLILGYAYAEKKQSDKALDYFKKAADANEDDMSTTPEALMIGAGYAQKIGKTKDAIEMYKKIKDKYPNYSAVSSGEIDKALATMGELN